MSEIVLSRGKWAGFDFMKNRHDLPVVACCYVIYFDGLPLYVGSTNNLRNRFCGRMSIRNGYAKDIKTPWGDFPNKTKITMKIKPTKKYGDWLMIEARLIKKLKPKLNIKLKGRAQ